MQLRIDMNIQSETDYMHFVYSFSGYLTWSGTRIEQWYYGNIGSVTSVSFINLLMQMCTNMLIHT